MAGRYAVLLTGASGERSATDRAEILVVEPALSISRVKEGEDGFIEVRNGGTVELDLSGFMLKSGAVTFAIPEGTILLAGNTTAYPSAVTRLLANLDDTVLLFPSGKEAARYTPVPPAPAAAPVKIAVAKSPPVLSKQPEAKEKVVIAAEFAPESVATSSLLTAAAGGSESSRFSIPLLALAGLIAVSVVGYLFFVRTPVPLQQTEADKMAKEAEQYELVE